MGRTFAATAAVLLATLATEPALALEPIIRHEFRGEIERGGFGLGVSAPGDVNGDTVPDLLFSSPNPVGANVNGNASASVYSGRTGERLHFVTAPLPMDTTWLGRGALGDVDGDGYGDFVAHFDL